MPTIVDQIRKAIEKRDGLSEEVMSPLASAYADEVDRVNQRLSEAVDLLRKGLRSEAIHRASLRPNALDAAAELDFPEVGEWLEILQFLGVPVPAVVDQDAAQQLNEAIVETQPLDELLRRHRRLAIAKAPLRWRLKVLRRIAQVDPMNQVWEEDLESWEKARLKEVPAELQAAISECDAKEVERICDELTKESWRVGPGASLVDQATAAAQQLVYSAHVEQLRGIAPAIHDAFSEFNETLARQTRDDWRHVQSQMTAPAPPDLQEQVAPAFAWLEELDRETEIEQQRLAAIGRLETALDRNKPVADIQRAYTKASRFEEPIPIELEQRYRVVIAGQSPQRRNTWRGRAEIMLASRARYWSQEPTGWRLPGPAAFMAIRLLTAKESWTETESKMMNAAAKRAASLSLVLLVFAVTGILVTDVYLQRVSTDRQDYRAIALIILGIMIAYILGILYVCYRWSAAKKSTAKEAPVVPRIFVSAVSSDLGMARKVVADALLRIECLPVEESVFGTEYGSVKEMLRRKIDGCHAVIHLVGRDFGGEPTMEAMPGGVPRRSWAQLEHDLAKELGKPLYIFFCEESFPFDSGQSEKTDDEMASLQARHRAAVLNDEHLWHTVRNTDDLRSHVEALKVPLEEIRLELQHEQTRRRRLINRLSWIAVLVVTLLLGIAWGIYRLTKNTADQTELIESISEARQKLDRAERLAGGVDAVVEMAEADEVDVATLRRSLRRLLDEFDAEYKLVDLPDEQAREITLANKSYNRSWARVFHRDLAIILAIEELGPATISRFAKDLELHPMFEPDFSGRMPEEVRTAAVSDQHSWLVFQASRWPDIVRGYTNNVRSTYHRPYWHYVSKPVFLSQAEDEAMSEGITANLATTYNAHQDFRMLNLVQALKRVTQRLAQPDTRGKERAILLCWMLNLTNEVHKPTHVASFFSSQRFPSGDRGGNRIRVKGGRTLHAMWCGSNGRLPFRAIQMQALDLGQDSRLAEVAENNAEVDIDLWFTESLEIAKTHVYSEIILEQIRVAEVDPGKDLELGLTDEYIEVMGAIARERTLLCAFRLAALIRSLYSEVN